MVSRGLLPSSTSEYPHPLDRPVADTGPWSASRHARRLCRRNHDGRAARSGRFVEREGVVGGVRGHARDLPVHVLDQTGACRGIINRRLCRRLRDDHPGAVDTEMEFLPGALAPFPVFRSSPFALADDRQPRTIDDEMKRSSARDAIECEVEVLTSPRECGVVRGVEIDPHYRQHGPQEALRLAQRQPEDQPKRQRRFDRQVRELPRPARSTGGRGSPGIHCVSGEPEGHVAAPHEGSLVLRPVSDVILGLVLRVHLRLHGEIVAQSRLTEPADPDRVSCRDRGNPTPTPRSGGVGGRRRDRQNR